MVCKDTQARITTLQLPQHHDRPLNPLHPGDADHPSLLLSVLRALSLTDVHALLRIWPAPAPHPAAPPAHAPCVVLRLYADTNSRLARAHADRWYTSRHAQLLLCCAMARRLRFGTYAAAARTHALRLRRPAPRTPRSSTHARRLPRPSPPPPRQQRMLSSHRPTRSTPPRPPRHAPSSRYPSTITPTSEYLRAPTNGYAHAGAPKRFVHLVGPPLDLALDARGVGGRGWWVRSGCWPNAEVRAYVCGGGDGRRRTREDEQRQTREEAEAKTHFGIFATRALKQGEEIVVGWEWDDANAVHRVGEVAGNGGCVALFFSSFCPQILLLPVLPAFDSRRSFLHFPV
ncbi:hypothetical protein B0H13DRAFT_2502093 [Mycena leptocephala]|nr:hypothetical protein B0H13DRAFT_2502093 [Mycena leptocephala]